MDANITVPSAWPSTPLVGGGREALPSNAVNSFVFEQWMSACGLWCPAVWPDMWAGGAAHHT
eukprot:5454958-Pyramimonas_sp.AAC.1